MTKLIRYIVVALAISAPGHGAKPKTPSERARACTSGETDVYDVVARLRRALLGPLSALAELMAEAENLEDLDEIIGELTENAEIVRAALVMGAAALTVADGGAGEVLDQQAGELNAAEGLAQDVRAALARLARRSVALVGQDSGPPVGATAGEADLDRALEEFMAVGRSPFAPRGDRWFTQGVLRLVVCAMGHLALDMAVLPAWIDAATLDELALKAVERAEAGLDLLLDPARPDRRVADAAHAHVIALVGTAQRGASHPLFDDETAG